MTKEEHYVAYHQATRNYLAEKEYIKILHAQWINAANEAREASRNQPLQTRLAIGRAAIQPYIEKTTEAEAKRDAYQAESDKHFMEWNKVD